MLHKGRKEKGQMLSLYTELNEKDDGKKMNNRISFTQKKTI